MTGIRADTDRSAELCAALVDKPHADGMINSPGGGGVSHGAARAVHLRRRPADAQHAGKIRHIGLSKVTVVQIEHAARVVSIAAVQNRYNLTEGDDDVLAHCEEYGIAFVPYKPLVAGALTRPTQTQPGMPTPAQAAIAHLRDRSANMLPILGTSNSGHLDENSNTAGRGRR